MKTLKTVCAAIAVLALLPGQTLRAGGLECAIDEALSSRNLLGTPIEVNRHPFTVKPVEMKSEAGARHTLAGVVVYHGKAAQQENVTYRIEKEGGAIKEVKIQINGGAWRGLSAEMTSALGVHARSGPMSKEDQDAAARGMFKAAQGSWEKAVEFLIVRIGVQHC